jgi:Cft2 family RNA processing exonuclease
MNSLTCRPDVLIVESTYGTHIHEKREDRENRFTSTVSDIVLRGGRCLIPVFALGKTFHHPVFALGKTFHHPVFALGTKYIYIKSTTLYVPSSELGLSHPLSCQQVCPSPRNQRRGGTLACG